MALVKRRKKQKNENTTKNKTADVGHTEIDESFTITDGNSVKRENHPIITSGRPLFWPEGATVDTTEASYAQGIKTETERETETTTEVKDNEHFFSIRNDTSINIATIAKTTMERETNSRTEAANSTNTYQRTSIENSFDHLIPSIPSTTRPIIVERFWTTVAEATTSVTPGKATDTITETTTNSNKEDINATLANDITSVNNRTMEPSEIDETTENIFDLTFVMTENSAKNTNNSTNKNKVTGKHSSSPSPNIASIAVSRRNISTKADNAIKLGTDITSFITVFTEPTVWDASTDSNPSELTKNDALSGEGKNDIYVGKTSEETNQASLLEEAEVQVFRWLLQLLPAGTQSEPRP